MSSSTSTTAITVTQKSGTYQTNSIEGKRASCTAGEHQAAERLGRKLYGASLVTVEPLTLKGASGGKTQWIAHAEAVKAWVTTDGLIDFGTQVPEGALLFASGMDCKLREQVGAAARHGKGNWKGRLIVPGVPEARTQRQKMTALMVWVDWRAKANGKPHSNGVVFSRSQE
jgi:hypothetical protein